MLLYRAGSATAANLTPRSEKDTAPLPGRPPGLSVFDTPEAALGGRRVGKVQVIDTDLLPTGLRTLPDDPAQGGTAGHYTIAPIVDTGAIDQARLEAWARRRDADEPDPLVEDVRAAIMEERRCT